MPPFELLFSSVPRLRTALAPCLLLCIVAAGCAPKFPITGSVPAPKAPPQIQKFHAGAARVDLTPIPGIGMNYSLNGYLSRGFWTRLYARAIYLEDTNGRAIVLVSSDLPHIPNGLGDRVAENLSKLSGNDGLMHLDGAQVILSATHTHHGPENWFSSALYNNMASARRGFDPQLFEFIADRITTAIHLAYQSRKAVSKVERRETPLDHFVRNRSLEAFLLNGESSDFLAANNGLSTDCAQPEGHTDGRACRAVSARVEVVEFIDDLGARIASAVFLATHPTVLSVETEVFSGDLFGAAAALVERETVEGCGDYGAPVVAIFNGAQGDVSPAWKYRDRPELLNVGQERPPGLAVRLAQFVCNKNPSVNPVTIHHQPLESYFGWLDFSEPRSATSHDCDPRHERCTERAPLAGVPSAGGAEDGRTFFYDVGLKEALRSDSRLKHGRKVLSVNGMNMQLPVSSIISPAGTAPKKIPLGVYRIGDLALVPLPGEFTTIMGERIRSAVAKKLDGQSQTSNHVILVGLANGHLSYVTTPEEFDAQHYEGAQNLYGAATGPVIQKRILELLEQAETGTRVEHENFKYDTGVCHVALPRDAGLPGYNVDDGLSNILIDLDEPNDTKRDYEPVCWVDAIPALPRVDHHYGDGSEDCVRAVPYVWIEPKQSAGGQCTTLPPEILDNACDTQKSAPLQTCGEADPRHCPDGKTPEDNCGLNLVTVLHGTYKDRTRWCAYWMPGNDEDPADYAVCVAGVTNDPVTELSGCDPSSDIGSCDPVGEFDLGNLGVWGWFQSCANHWVDQLECSGHRTRNVCKAP